MVAGYGRIWIRTEGGYSGAINGNSISFVVDIKPDKPIFGFNSGLAFQTIYSYGSTVNFLKLPVGIDFLIGKKNQFFFGSGIYGQSLLFETPEFYDNHLHFQFGAFADIGFRFRLNDTYSLFFKLQYDRDLTPIYKLSHHSPGGIFYYEHEFLSDISINIGFKFKLNSKL